MTTRSISCGAISISSAPPRPDLSEEGQRSLASPRLGKQQPSRCLYIGIDFGTTYSGVAWAWSGDPDNINIVSNWNTAGSNLAHARDDAKAPTAIHYGPGGITWGHGIHDDEDPIRWFKLLLLKEEDIQDDVRDSEYLTTAARSLQDQGKTPVEAVADYLQLLWQHTIASIKRERGARGVDGLPFKVVLTIPAIWKPYAYAKMKRAVEMAGILDSRPCGKTSIAFVPEPEAAALATLSEFRGRSDVEKGDVFVVCDVGGGTADIISYKIKETGPLILYESVEGKGKLCGAIFADEKFQTMIRERMGSKWEKLSRCSRRKLMNDDWEYGIKRSFDGDTTKKWTVQLPPEAVPRFGRNRLNDKKKDMPIVAGHIQLGTGHIKGVFGQVMGDIRKLVRDQINNIYARESKLPKAVILVGGFGACNYLYETLRKEYMSRGIQILQPRRDGPWTAICRGAVIRAGSSGTSSIVQSRVSRFSYGISSSRVFIDGVHDKRDRYFSNCCRKWKAEKQMKWYVRKGEDVSILEPIKIKYVKHFQNPLPGNVMSVKIAHSEADEPPDRRRDESVDILCTINCQLDTEFEDLPEMVNEDGVRWRELHFTVEMVPEHASLQFKCYVNGQEQGQQSIDVEFDML